MGYAVKGISLSILSRELPRCSRRISEPHSKRSIILSYEDCIVLDSAIYICPRPLYHEAGGRLDLRKRLNLTRGKIRVNGIGYLRRIYCWICVEYDSRFVTYLGPCRKRGFWHYCE